MKQNKNICGAKNNESTVRRIEFTRGARYCLLCFYLCFDDFLNHFDCAQMRYAGQWARHFFRPRRYFLIEHFFGFAHNQGAWTRFD